MIQRDKPKSFFQALAQQLSKPKPAAQPKPATPTFSGGGGRRPGTSGCACSGKR